MIHSVSGVRPGVIPNIIRARGTLGKLSVPVHPINMIYARFKHVRGIPASEGGVSVLKLRILDNLIDKLLSYREKVPGVSELKLIDAENIDSLMHNLQQRLRDHVISSVPFFSGFYPETGILINMVA